MLLIPACSSATTTVYVELNNFQPEKEGKAAGRCAKLDILTGYPFWSMSGSPEKSPL